MMACEPKKIQNGRLGAILGVFYLNCYILTKFGTHVALVRSFKVNISCFGKIQYGRQFCRFQLFLNYDLTYLEKYCTDFNEI